MRTAQPGDRVQVHYVIRWQDGSMLSSHGRSPLKLTVGVEHPRLPGLGLALVGLRPGMRRALTVPPERAYGLSDPAQIRPWSRKRFSRQTSPRIGQMVRFTDNRGRRLLGRILLVGSHALVIDTNHRWAGQALDLEVDLLTIDDPTDRFDAPGPSEDMASEQAADSWTSGRELPVFSSPASPSEAAKVVAFDVDPASLTVLAEAFAGWQLEVIDGGIAATVARDRDPARADLLVVGLGDNIADTLGLCRFLAFCTAYSRDFHGGQNPGKRGLPGRVPGADAPLLVLVPPEQEDLVRLTLEAGADSCLTLPIHAKQVAHMRARVRAGNQPGRHTLNLDHAQQDDPWRDEGGQG